ncbi:MAG: protoporphyrinogen oxidase HemJ [Campylobacter sp.]|nr:protoporphyrinogen oxidase HemJ [Campylobacter sp.]
MEALADYYGYFRFAHYIFFVSWMAMLFYQPRLYVYHAENMDKPDFVKVVEVMEYKMYNYIGWVAIIGSFTTGALILLAVPGLLSSGYIHLKLTVVVLLAIYHFSLGWYMKTLKEGRCKKSGMFFRGYNEIPTVALIIIIWMIVFKPF